MSRTSIVLGQDPLGEIVGEQLSSIEFVQDYVQIRFDGPTLTAITHPIVAIDGTRHVWDDLGYCDALRRCIGRKVLKASTLAGVSIGIDLEGGASISVSLRPEDYQDAEAAIFQGRTEWMTWRIEASAPNADRR